MVAQFDGKNGGFDPYRGFKFRLHWDGRVVAGVSKVAALDRLDGQVQHRELGNASAHDKPPTATAFEVVTIERGAGIVAVVLLLYLPAMVVFALAFTRRRKRLRTRQPAPPRNAWLTAAGGDGPLVADRFGSR